MFERTGDTPCSESGPLLNRTFASSPITFCPASRVKLARTVTSKKSRRRSLAVGLIKAESLRGVTDFGS